LNCQLGSWMSAFGLQARVPMGASHAIGHVLGGTCGVPHYYCTAVMMPSVLRYNLPATEAAQKSISAALGGPGRDASEVFVAFIAELGLPPRLAEVGVAEDRFELIGKHAMLSIFTRANRSRSDSQTMSSRYSNWPPERSASCSPPALPPVERVCDPERGNALVRPVH
jgi:maleylacetate reductase